MCGTDRNQNRVLERWEIAALTELEFLLKVAGEVVVPRKLNGRTKCRVSLHEDLARRFAAPSASGDLREKLKGAFACAEIRQVQSEICIDDSHQRHIWEMQTFC